MAQRANQPEDVWKRVVRGAPEDCWLWTGSTVGFGYIAGQGRTKKAGYGRINIGGRMRLTHHVAYELGHGPIPHGLRVLHRCDTPRCCNPAHLYAGTMKDNARDIAERDRRVYARGEKHGRSRAKLTPSDVRSIRERLTYGCSINSLAAAHGVHHETIRSIAVGLTWSHIRT